MSSNKELQYRVAVLEKALKNMSKELIDILNITSGFPTVFAEEDEIEEKCQQYICQAENELCEVPPTFVEKVIVPRKLNRFVAPSLEEVKAYAEQKGHSDLADKFYEYFSEGDWTDSKGQKVKNWKQKFITWATYNSGGRKGAETKTAKHEYDYLYDNDLDEL